MQLTKDVQVDCLLWCKVIGTYGDIYMDNKYKPSYRSIICLCLLKAATLRKHDTIHQYVHRVPSCPTCILSKKHSQTPKLQHLCHVHFVSCMRYVKWYASRTIGESCGAASMQKTNCLANATRLANSA
jgi:hypothetical protein